MRNPSFLRVCGHVLILAAILLLLLCWGIIPILGIFALMAGLWLLDRVDRHDKFDAMISSVRREKK